MRIEIRETTEQGKPLLVALEDDNLDNDNFIDLDFDERIVTVPLDELFSALIAFDSQRSRRLNRECSCE